MSAGTAQTTDKNRGTEIQDRELLLEIDGVGSDVADDLLAHFGHGYWVAQSACRYWGELEKVNGVTEQQAREFFDKMQESEVWDELNSDRALVEALEKGHDGRDHGGGY